MFAFIRKFFEDRKAKAFDKAYFAGYAYATKALRAGKPLYELESEVSVIDRTAFDAGMEQAIRDYARWPMDGVMR